LKLNIVDAALKKETEQLVKKASYVHLTRLLGALAIFAQKHLSAFQMMTASTGNNKYCIA
jgi:hypothetical protein